VAQLQGDQIGHFLQLLEAHYDFFSKDEKAQKIVTF
jgi:hypothetical protein